MNNTLLINAKPSLTIGGGFFFACVLLYVIRLFIPPYYRKGTNRQATELTTIDK